MSNAPRNPIAVAMNSRYGRTTTTMKDRRAPRGGNRNIQAEYLAEYEEDQDIEQSLMVEPD